MGAVPLEATCNPETGRALSDAGRRLSCRSWRFPVAGCRRGRVARACVWWLRNGLCNGACTMAKDELGKEEGRRPANPARAGVRMWPGGGGTTACCVTTADDIAQGGGAVSGEATGGREAAGSGGPEGQARARRGGRGLGRGRARRSPVGARCVRRSSCAVSSASALQFCVLLSAHCLRDAG
eukprot:364503-Chlamydomonas_euryale.AAC.5